MKMWQWILACFLLVQTAVAFELGGVWQQGGYITGKGIETDVVSINGVKVPVLEGRFLYGLKRYYPIEAQVVVKDAAGKVTKQTLLIEPRTYKTQHITGVTSNTVEPNKAEIERAQADSAAIKAARQAYSNQPSVFAGAKIPVTGRNSGVYGSRRTFEGKERSWHKGYDIAVPQGTPVKAGLAGVVTLARDTFFSGNLVIVDHGYGLHSHYAHLHTMKVQAGDKVTADTVIGTVGKTGRATGPHLHWGLFWKNEPIDPALWLPPQAQ